MSLAIVPLALALGAAAARAQEAAAVPASDADADEPSSQMMGASLGFQSGIGGVAPGGLRLSGDYLYRLDERSWFDGGASFVFGGGGRACFYDRDLDLVCEHGIADGFGMALEGGLRFTLAPRPSGLMPYVRAGVSLSYARFGDDDVAGGALGIFGGAGGTFVVANRVRVGGEALLRVGAGLYNRDLGLETLGEFVVQFGVVFEL